MADYDKRHPILALQHVMPCQEKDIGMGYMELLFHLSTIPVLSLYYPFVEMNIIQVEKIISMK